MEEANLAFGGISAVMSVVSVGLQIADMLDDTTDNLLRTVISNLQIIEQQQQTMIAQLGVVITLLASILNAIQQLPIAPTLIRIQNVPQELVTLQTTGTALETLYMNQWLGIGETDPSLGDDLATLQKNIIGAGLLTSPSIVSDFYNKSFTTSGNSNQAKLAALCYLINVMSYQTTGYAAYMWALSAEIGYVDYEYQTFINQQLKDEAKWARHSLIGNVWLPAYKYTYIGPTMYALSSPQTFSANGKLFVVGLQTVGQRGLVCRVFDPSTISWSQIAIPSATGTVFSVGWDNNLAKWVLVTSVNQGLSVSMFNTSTETWDYFLQTSAARYEKLIPTPTQTNYMGAGVGVANFLTVSGTGVKLWRFQNQIALSNFLSGTVPSSGTSCPVTSVLANGNYYIVSIDGLTISWYSLTAGGASLAGSFRTMQTIECGTPVVVIPKVGSLGHDLVATAYLQNTIANVVMIDTVTGHVYTASTSLGPSLSMNDIDMKVIGGTAYLQVSQYTLVFGAENEPGTAWEFYSNQDYFTGQLAALLDSSMVPTNKGAVGGVPVLVQNSNVWVGIPTEMHATVVPGF